MNHTCTFIPTQRAKDLLCELFAEFHCPGSTREILYSLRDELGADEFGRFQADLAKLMHQYTARIAVRMIIEARDPAQPCSLPIFKDYADAGNL